MPGDLVLRGVLKGHAGWVTAIACPVENPNLILSSSRDKSVIVWTLTREEGNYGYAKRLLTGHSHFVQDVAVSWNGDFALSGSWDESLRLWDLNSGKTTRRFAGHTNDVLSVAFSDDGRYIVSGSRDKSIKLWNNLGECKYTINDTDAHQEWVSCVRFSPHTPHPLVVSAGWDKVVKVWNLNDCKIRTNLLGHTGYINTVAVSPDGLFCASGGKDGFAIIWDHIGGQLYDALDAGDIIHALCFRPIWPWLCAATQQSIKIWDLQSCSIVEELTPDFHLGKKAQVPYCISLNWSADGSTLYSGYTDGLIRVWELAGFNEALQLF